MIMLIPCAGNVKASENAVQNTNTKNSNVQTEREYVIDELGYYLSGWDVDTDAVVKMSEKYDINNAENDSTIYFVQVDDKIVGTITVFEYEGERISSFMYKEEGIEEIPEDEEFAVASNGEGIDICTKTSTKFFSGDDSGREVKRKNENNYDRKKLKYYDISEKVTVDSEAMKVEMNDLKEETTDIFTVEPKNLWNTNIVNVGTHEKTYDTIISYKQTLLKYLIQVPFRKNYDIGGGIYNNNNWTRACF